jgi:hypothetical protein
LRRIITVFSDVRVKRRPYQDGIRRITYPHLGGEGETNKINILLIQAQQKAIVEGAKVVGQLRGYLMENSFGLRNYRLEIDGYCQVAKGDFL